MASAVIVIDVQNCFLPGGSLGTVNSRNSEVPPSTLAKSIAKFINEKNPEHFFITKDSHTPGHSSFITNEQRANGMLNFPTAAGRGEFAKGIASGRYSGRKFKTQRAWGVEAERVDQKLWPEHCVKGTPGEDIDAFLMDTLSEENKEKAVIVLKGDTPDIDSYSAVADALGDPTPHLEDGRSFLSVLQGSDVKTVYLTGIARDVCVFWTALDLLNFWIIPEKQKGNTIKLVFKYDLTRPVASGGAPYTDKTPDQINAEVDLLIANMGGDIERSDIFVIEEGGYSAAGGRRRRCRHTKRHCKCKSRKSRKSRR